MSKSRYTPAHMAMRAIAALGMLTCTGCASILPSGLAPAQPSVPPTISEGAAVPNGAAVATVEHAVGVEQQRLELKSAPPPGPKAKSGEGVGSESRSSKSSDARVRPHAFQREFTASRASQKAPASLHANLSPAQCRTRLAATKTTAFKRQGPTSGIANPLRIAGEVGGVRFVAPGGKSPYGLLDCRLALTLIQFADFLKARGIVEVRVDNFYRPNARLPSKRSKKSQHAYGLAIDVMALKHEDGRVFDIEADWGAGIETEACGPKATVANVTESTVDLRNLVCELVDSELFHHHLTPSYNRAHRNHLHLDIKRDAKALWVR